MAGKWWEDNTDNFLKILWFLRVVDRKQLSTMRWTYFDNQDIFYKIRRRDGTGKKC
jgi:hypothetical protein